MKFLYSFLVISLVATAFFNTHVSAQNSRGATTAPVYVDNKGVLRWKSNNAEAAFFGVNYTIPFAYGYRSHQALGVDLEKAIDQDVYHLARLGFDAFRVHVWDTEISDSVGNLLQNEHLRLFDYLISKLKERNIKILITPIAFWGPGYPEKDLPTAGFSSMYSKQQAVTEEKAFLAQENYLQQFFKHINPYTNLSYQNDPDVIAAEVNNEPHHTGPKERTTEYVNRMVAAIRSTGWAKPIFYNISESPKYADAVARAHVDGFSFQWYPTGLVANRTLQGNYLPHVAKYHIPFDTIPQFANKALMVYEFDAGDIMEPIMYPAMARSFREAGFQWATQFAYDPLATAHANTEYQTHYVNLAYTPSKAISLMIASKVFHNVARLQKTGTHPNDTLFDAFRLSYKQALSEMNTDREFYYTNSTRTAPANAGRLQHIAGVGSSPVVEYRGNGAYFLDKLENGIWRLEVMPDAIQIRDPYGKASPGREVTRIQWQSHPMQIKLAGLGDNFSIKALNPGNTYTATAQNGNFTIQPGTYLLVQKGKTSIRWTAQKRSGVLGLAEFVAPQSAEAEPFVRHEPKREISSGGPFVLQAQVTGIQANDKLSVVANNYAGVWKTITMERAAPYTYTAVLPTELTTPGQISYRILVEKGDGATYAFPGGYKGDPWAWDYTHAETWQTYIASPQGNLELFNATHDRNLTVFPNLWRSNERQLTASDRAGQLVLHLAAEQLPAEGVMGWQTYVKDKLEGRAAELATFDRIVIRARTVGVGSLPVKVGLLTSQASAFTAQVALSNEFQNIAIPLNTLQADAFMLLPRPYPHFHPFWYKSAVPGTFNLNRIEKLEFRTGDQMPANEAGKPYVLEVEAIWLEKAGK